MNNSCNYIGLFLARKSEGVYAFRVENNADIEESIISAILNNNGLITFQRDNNIDLNNCFKTYFVVHSVREFLSEQPERKEDVQDYCQMELLSKPNRCPILHIVPTDIFIQSLYRSKTPLNKKVPRSFQIIDNSIWNYFVPLYSVTYYYEKKDNNGDIVEEKEDVEWNILFHNAIDSIIKNYEKGLYSFPVTNEYADLNARLVSESFLSGSHAKGVSPIIFHSEGVMKYLIEKEFVKQRQTIDEILNQKWRILLVDDKANRSLLGDNEIVRENLWDSKLKIIKNLLEKQFNITFKMVQGEKRIISSCIEIEYVEDLESAKDAIKKSKYKRDSQQKEKIFDIILLDYLLKENGTFNYGYDLLEDISDQKERDKYKIGPNNKFYFMFISAYSTAVYERLLAEGLNQSEKYWHVAVGACPTNTPQLFLYNLIKLMEKRLDDSHISDLSTKGIVDTVSRIFDSNSPRLEAGDSFQDIQNLQYHYRSILKSVEVLPKSKSVFETSGSVLMTNFIQNHIQLGALLEHLAQLIHITAFGTIRQWSEMWEEYLYFKSQLEKLLGYNIEIENKQRGYANDKMELQNRFEKMCCDIEEYIRKMKSSVI